MQFRRYTMLGLQDIDLGFAGRKTPGHPIHAALAALTPGSRLTARMQGDRLLLFSKDRPVAALSRAASAGWRDRIENIVFIQVVAMVRRTAEDGDPAYRRLYHSDCWEVPLVEIACRAE